VCTAPTPNAPVVGASERLEIAEVFRNHGEEYRRTRALTGVQLKAMRGIVACRTPALGGLLETCDQCSVSRVVFRSCRNRHCPKCQTLAQQRWLQARREDLLPVGYFHVVFTLPHELNRLALREPRLVYDLLFQSAAQTLKEFGRDPKHLGGDLGITAVLHTWGQNLSQHVHLHCVVTGGALAKDGSRWIPARPKFLFPVKALSRVFRGKYLDALHRAFDQGKLPPDEPWDELGAQLRRNDWVVYAKPPFGGSEQVLSYLARYTHRIAISNTRLIDMHDGVLRFRWRDYSDGNRTKVMALEVPEFIRRFLVHVLPDRFVRIRHFGLLANRHRKEKLARCRELLGRPASPPEPTQETVEAMVLRLTGIELSRCPACQQGRMRQVRTLAPGQLPPPSIQLIDSS